MFEQLETKKIYWVGPRKTDIEFVKDIPFYGSVTLFGDGKENNYAFCLNEGQNRINHNLTKREEDEFIYNTVKGLIEQDKDSRFYFYNPNAVYTIPGLSEYKDYFYCLNDGEILKKLRDKKFFYDTLKDEVPLLDHSYDFHRSNCSYAQLLRVFGLPRESNKRFIFQAQIASGGSGTYLVSRENVKDVTRRLTDDNYILSVYRENNVPVNIHAIIFDDEILLSPGSIQIMKEDDDRLLYRGADFITYRTIDAEKRKFFEDSVRKACKVFQAEGYRGVCGIDGIICEDEVLLLEINNRFQASSGLIDLAAKKLGVPSLQWLNYAAFYSGWKEEYRALETLKVEYSNYFYTDNGRKFHSNYIYSIAKKLESEKDSCVVKVEEDGFSEEQSTNQLAYLYRIVFNTNVTALDVEGKIQINENVAEPKEEWHEELTYSVPETAGWSLEEKRDYYLRLKISLLVQGIVIDEKTQAVIEAAEGIRPATNNAVDLEVKVPFADGTANKYLIINAPVDIKFVEFSPFLMKHTEKVGEDGKTEYTYQLYYYDEFITDVGIYPKDFLEEKYTKETANKRSVPYKEVAFLSTDRLRVHLTNYCKFKRVQDGKYMGCQFCNIAPSLDVMELENIEEVVEDYCTNHKELGLKHFLVGGQTADDEHKEKIVEIVRIIRRHARFAPIYAMLIPYEKELIKKLYEAGMTQLACNIEVFDDKIAAKYMPGKRGGENTAKFYIERLKYATMLLGRKGSVRSMLIVGLEPKESLMRGIEELARNGIQPILSIFRPLPKTPMVGWNPPSMSFLFEVYGEISKKCREYKMSVGPECVNCQNNTLALPSWLDV